MGRVGRILLVALVAFLSMGLPVSLPAAEAAAAGTAAAPVTLTLGASGGGSIAATPPAYVFTRNFIQAKIVALVACGLGGLLPLPFLLGRWVHAGKFGLTAACIAAALALCLVALARTADPTRRLANVGLAVVTVAVVFAVGASGNLGLWLPLGALAWVALPTVAMKTLR